MSRFLEPLATTTQAPAEDPEPGFNSMTILSSPKILEKLRFSVVRIQAVKADNDWFKPWQPFSEKQGVGTGFIISNDDHGVLVVTNAHVVNNALSVQVQLPAIGQDDYEAYVPIICNTFDLALVHITDSQKLRTAVESQNQTLRSLSLRSAPIEIGSEVAAFGFPLGSLSPKLSRGVISGIEDVGNQISYQTTAPISPGNSGGPLLAFGQKKVLEVAGVTFASSTGDGSQNNNYVVPAMRVQQVLHEFKNSSQQKVGVGVLGTPLKTGQDGKVEVSSMMDLQRQQHQRLQLAPIGAITVEADEALYNSSGGCHEGVFISNILPLSLLRLAEPPVTKHSFLTWVGKSKLDSFGMGRTPLFLGGPIPFEGLFALGKSPRDSVELATCKNGTVTKHTASLTWRKEYAPGVNDVVEPLYSPGSTDFEVFAGITIMQMTENHIKQLMTNGAPVTLGRWLLPEFQLLPHLIITHIKPNTYAEHVLARGMVLSQLNEQNVSTLDDFRKHFNPEGESWKLETDRGLLFTVSFPEMVKKQLEQAQGRESNQYLVTKLLKEAATKLGITTEGSGSSNLLKSSKVNVNSTEIIGKTGISMDDSKTPGSSVGVVQSHVGVVDRHVPEGPASLAEEAVTAAAQATAAARVAELAAGQAAVASNLARKAVKPEADDKRSDSAAVASRNNRNDDDDDNSAGSTNLLALGHNSIVF
jgi:S1-C subfamily serine protease